MTAIYQTHSFRIRMARLMAASILALLAIISVNAQTSATDGSTPTGMQPGAPAGSYTLSDFDNVNLFNGHLNFRLPLLSVGGRGSAGYTINLNLERQWRTRKTPSPPWATWPETGVWGALQVGYSPGVLIGRVVGAPNSGLCSDNEGWRDTLTRLTFVGADGTEYELRDVLHNGDAQTSYYNVDCSVGYTASRGKVFVSKDGSGVTFISDVDILDAYGFAIDEIYPSGYLLLKDGTRYRIDGGRVSSIKDRSGNKVTFSSNQITDSLNRAVTIAYANMPNTPYDEITFAGKTIRVWYSPMSAALRSGFSIQTFQQLFPEMNGSSSQPFNPTAIVSSVELPDGRRYYFKYNSYGEVARVELPTGGAVEYDYAAGLRSGAVSGSYGGGGGYTTKQIYRRVVERRIYKDSSAIYESRMTISRPENSVTETDGYVLVEQRDYSNNLLASDKHYYFGTAIVPNNLTATDYSHWKDGRELKTESYNSITDKVLRRVENTWEQPLNGATWPLTQSEASTLVRANDPQLTQSVMTLVAQNGSETDLMSMQTFAYDRYGNRTDVYEYDFGSGGPGSFMRRTHTDFLTTNQLNSIAYDTVNPNTTSPSIAATIHQRSLPTETWISSDAAGNTKVADTLFKYDDSSYPLFTYGAFSGWDDPATTARGNPTTIRRWLNTTSSYIDVSARFDQFGNLRYAWDGKGNLSQIEYSSSFNYGFPTKTITPVPDAAGQYGSTTSLETNTTYDLPTGLVLSVVDANNATTTFDYNDPLNRLKRVTRPDGGNTNYTYGDTVNNLYVRTDTDQTAAVAMHGYQYFDGLGRAVRSFTYVGTPVLTPYSTVDTEYDALGRVRRVSNPYFSALGGPVNPPGLWTTTAYDIYGRVTSVTTPDNLVVGTAYSSDRVLVTDQTSKQRISRTNALGHLKEVWEITPNLPGQYPGITSVSFPNHPEVVMGYQTTYGYSTLDDLTNVTQGSQPARTFAYDSFKRLASATNPESGTVTYLYDNNGNLTRKTDARGIYIDYGYDALNRSTTVNYSDTTIGSPDVPDVSRFYDGAANGKGRFWYFYAGGNYSVGSNVEQRAIDGYDALGRPLTERQLFKFNGVWGPTYTNQQDYNLAGHVKTQTYPSGHIVTYKYDVAGRLNDDGASAAMTGTLGDGVTRTYATALSYDAASRSLEEKYGTTTLLYHKQHYNIRGQLYDIRLSTVPWQTDEWEWNRVAVLDYYDSSLTPQNPNSGPDNNGNLRRQDVFIPTDDQISSYNFMRQDYTYDALNRLSSVTELQNGSSTSFMQAYQYDRWGNRTINPASWGSGINSVQTVPDNNSNRMYAPNDPYHSLVDYDLAGNQTKDYLTWNGTRTYDAENRMLTASNGTTDKYTYDADGKRTRRKVGKLETWYVYGIGGELVAEYAPNAPANTPDKEYGYRNGQLLVTAAPVDVALGKSATQKSTFVSGATTFSAGLAVDGNTNGTFWDLSSATTNYDYQNWWQVDLGSSQSLSSIQVWPRTDCCPEHTANFYILVSDNAFTSTDLTTTLNQPGVSSYWFTGNNATAATVTINRTGRYIRVQRNDSQYLVLAEVKVWQTTADVQWLVTDQLGTPRMIADATGSLAGIKRHDYLPFGEELTAGTGGRTSAQGYSLADGNRKRWAELERDDETGLDYAQARYYSNIQGRFTSVDPDNYQAMRDLHDPQSWNAYAYVNNSPLGRNDPNGRGFWEKLKNALNGYGWRSNEEVQQLEDKWRNWLREQEASNGGNLINGCPQNCHRVDINSLSRNDVFHYAAELKYSIEHGTAIRYTQDQVNQMTGVTPPAPAVAQTINFSARQLEKKFKHAEDFGVRGNYNSANGTSFQKAIEEHINDPATKVIEGTYRGQSVTHYVNLQTGLNVMKDASGNFLSGWKLNPSQLTNVLTRGKL